MTNPYDLVRAALMIARRYGGSVEPSPVRRGYEEGGPIVPTRKSRVPAYDEQGNQYFPDLPIGEENPDPQWPFFDPVKALGAAAEGIPFSGMGGNAPGAVTRGVRHIASIPAAFPKTTLGVAGAAGLGATMQDAGAPDVKSGDPMRLEIHKLEQEIQSLTQDMNKQMNTIRTKSGRDGVAENYNARIRAKENRIKELNQLLGSEDKRLLDEAVTARDKVLRDAPKPFQRSMFGQYIAPAIPWLPVLAGAYTGYKMTVPKALAEREALSKWVDAVTRASATQSPRVKATETAVAKNYDDAWPVTNFATKAAQAYPATAGLAAVEGAIVPNLMPAYNSIWLESENPERKALQEFVRKAPENHPEALRAKRMLDDETVLPKGNPDLEAARRYFSNWKTEALPRAGASALEAIAGSIPTTTAGIVSAPWERSLPRPRTRALVDELPPRMSASGSAGSAAPQQRQTKTPPAPEPPAKQQPTAQLPDQELQLPEATAPKKATPDPTTTTPARTSTPPNRKTEPASAGNKYKHHPGERQLRDHRGKYGPNAPSEEVAPGVPRKPPRLPTDDDPGFRRYGGAVKGALAIARKHGGGVTSGYADGGAIVRALARLLGRKGRTVAPVVEKAPISQGKRDLYALETHKGPEGRSAVGDMPRPANGDEAVRQQKFWDALTDEPPTPTLHADGGRIRDIARRYAGGRVGRATGGSVLAGPVIGDTGGRDDAKNVSVASGSYVVPAETVSNLGAGNSNAGLKLLAHMFPPSAGYAQGGAPTPIKISDGEYVITPEQVAKIGGGSLEQGHRILDQLILELRQHHIDTLSQLPGPATD